MKIKLLSFILLIGSTLNAQDFEGLKKINGTSLYFKIFGTGEPIVIVHGGPGMNHSYFMPHLNALSKKYKIVLYDQRASGRSAIPSADSISLRFFVDDLEAIRRELGVEKMVLLGHSWGAIPVVTYGIQYPDKVKKMILCNPNPLSKEFDEEALNNLRKKATSLDTTDRSIIMGSPEFKSGNPEAYKKLLLLSFRHLFYNPVHAAKLQIDIPSNYLAASQALFTSLGKDLVQYDFHESVGSFSFPVLILHGDADVVPLTASEKTKASIPGAQLTLFKRSGHFIFIEEAGKFRKVVAEFVK